MYKAWKGRLRQHHHLRTDLCLKEAQSSVEECSPVVDDVVSPSASTVLDCCVNLTTSSPADEQIACTHYERRDDCAEPCESDETLRGRTLWETMNKSRKATPSPRNNIVCNIACPTSITVAQVQLPTEPATCKERPTEPVTCKPLRTDPAICKQRQAEPGCGVKDIVPTVTLRVRDGYTAAKVLRPLGGTLSSSGKISCSDADLVLSMIPTKLNLWSEDRAPISDKLLTKQALELLGSGGPRVLQEFLIQQKETDRELQRKNNSRLLQASSNIPPSFRTPKNSNTLGKSESTTCNEPQEDDPLPNVTTGAIIKKSQAQSSSCVQAAVVSVNNNIRRRHRSNSPGICSNRHAVTRTVPSTNRHIIDSGVNSSVAHSSSHRNIHSNEGRPGSLRMPQTASQANACNKTQKLSCRWRGKPSLSKHLVKSQSKDSETTPKRGCPITSIVPVKKEYEKTISTSQWSLMKYSDGSDKQQMFKKAHTSQRWQSWMTLVGTNPFAEVPF
eukprot:GHVQ01013685.1.p1 GENE.GHVQ01013685.1~~GHVQ01013685.1.p1  ORF type:complete len:501 (-),score=50.11 GHVQ01013685.1:238-1740(-)